MQDRLAEGAGPGDRDLSLMLQEQRSGSKYDIVFAIREPQNDFELVERPTQDEQNFDFLRGVKHWWQDNVGFGFGLGDDSEAFNREDEVDEVHLLQNVTQQTRMQQLQVQKTHAHTQRMQMQKPRVGSTAISNNPVPKSL